MRLKILSEYVNRSFINELKKLALRERLDLKDKSSERPILIMQNSLKNFVFCNVIEKLVLFCQKYIEMKKILAENLQKQSP